MHIQSELNCIFRISMLFLHVSALYERHLQGAKLGTYDVAYAQFHQDF
jgi:hypothetical protein